MSTKQGEAWTPPHPSACECIGGPLDGQMRECYQGGIKGWASEISKGEWSGRYVLVRERPIHFRWVPSTETER